MLIGARQVGKTTLLKEILDEIADTNQWFNAEESDILYAFTHATTSTQLQQLTGAVRNKIVVIDEAQLTVF